MSLSRTDFFRAKHRMALYVLIFALCPAPAFAQSQGCSGCVLPTAPTYTISNGANYSISGSVGGLDGTCDYVTCLEVLNCTIPVSITIIESPQGPLLEVDICFCSKDWSYGYEEPTRGLSCEGPPAGDPCPTIPVNSSPITLSGSVACGSSTVSGWKVGDAEVMYSASCSPCTLQDSEEF